MNLRAASVQPRLATSIEEARQLVLEDGAARVLGVDGPDGINEYGRAFMGDAYAMMDNQSTIDPTDSKRYRTNVPRNVPDERGRTVVPVGPSRSLWVHNDGKSFGDLAPEYILLWLQQACPEGGDSVLVDGATLLDLLAQDPANADLVDFCWTVPIDHSEAFAQRDEYAPIARRAPKGGVQVRWHPNLRSVVGPDQEAHQAMIDRWQAFVRQADDEALPFRIETGEMVIVDNYRLMHGRRPYVSPERLLLQHWGWTRDAFGVPVSKPDFERPTTLVAS